MLCCAGQYTAKIVLNPLPRIILASYYLISTYVVGRSCTGNLGHSRNATCSKLGHSGREIGLACCCGGSGRDVSRGDLYRENFLSVQAEHRKGVDTGKGILRDLKAIVRLGADISPRSHFTISYRQGTPYMKPWQETCWHCTLMPGITLSVTYHIEAPCRSKTHRFSCGLCICASKDGANSQDKVKAGGCHKRGFRRSRFWEAGNMLTHM